MSAAAAPHFWAAPLRYCAWAARERPAYFWSVVIGGIGPAAMPFAPAIRRAFGDVDPAPIPVTYPVPTGPRKQLTGYDDE
ncbi:Putative NADH-ubiquinone oxidoreductase 9.5 kDa subunit [[Torrubiella] hemipterigena]|uniref:Putative NADH-ubiquinone oxidoreductase 9.5 kDa subunit n=1 Tax=[Torrubiella] hemipterigena TaxID=1531966 RepID=A0A0A1SZW1_9HYPO|nr:Putative NADH-ubiquinone oxidoreductase 9.5 kDa subunit [[Torrubiella] hemipterigena]